MPVKLNVFQSAKALSAQDVIDLDKLYCDHPHAADIPAVADLLGHESVSLYAARFNDRLLGAVFLNSQGDSDSWQMQYFCVRKLTRRRHVAHDLLREICQLEHAQGAQLLQTIDEPGAAPELMAFLMAEGFVKKGNNFTLTLGCNH